MLILGNLKKTFVQGCPWNNLILKGCCISLKQHHLYHGIYFSKRLVLRQQSCKHVSDHLLVFRWLTHFCSSYTVQKDAEPGADTPLRNEPIREPGV